MLAKHVVQTGPGSGVAEALKVVHPSLLQWAHPYLNVVTRSGSFAKGTAVAGTTDLDLFISIRSDAPHTLKEIYENLYAWAESKYWLPQRQNVSIGISWLGTKVDLVPGKKQKPLSTDHSLWTNKKQTWTQTNVWKHVQTVSVSGRTREIRALKIWRKCHGLDFPSFYLELSVINALRGKIPGVNLATNVSACLEYLRDNLETARVVDPANTNNIISDDLTTAEKKVIAQAARRSRDEPYWEQVLW